MGKYILLLFSVMLAVAGQLLFKMGMTVFGQTSLTAFFTRIGTVLTNPYILGGLAVFFLSAALWVIVLSKLPISVAYPMISIGYVFVLIFSALFLGESITAFKVIGIVLICFGVYFISREKRRPQSLT